MKRFRLSDLLTQDSFLSTKSYFTRPVIRFLLISGFGGFWATINRNRKPYPVKDDSVLRKLSQPRTVVTQNRDSRPEVWEDGLTPFFRSSKSKRCSLLPTGFDDARAALGGPFSAPDGALSYQDRNTGPRAFSRSGSQILRYFPVLPPLAARMSIHTLRKGGLGL